MLGYPSTRWRYMVRSRSCSAADRITTARYLLSFANNSAGAMTVTMQVIGRNGVD
jgi:hypothetical protein